MKIILTAWLIYNGAVVPESITQTQRRSMAECIAKGEEVRRYFDGKRTLHIAQYICTEEGVEL